MEMNRALLIAGVMLAVIIGVPLLLGAFGVSGYDTGSAIGNSLLWVIENPWVLGLALMLGVLALMLRNFIRRR
jgi:hypothetical protein